MSLENPNINKREDDEEENFSPEEIPKPKWSEQSEDYYPEDLELVDEQYRNLEEIAQEFRDKYGLVEKKLITFNREKREWEIDNKSPEKWNEEWLKLNSKENRSYTDI